MRILYADADVASAERLLPMLSEPPAQRAPGHRPQIEHAQSVADARALIEAACTLHAADTGFDLLLTDLRLPDGAGIELLSEVQARRLPTAVVVLSHPGNEADVAAALRAGADGHLSKDGDLLRQLWPTLDSALDRMQSVRGPTAQALRLLYVEPDVLEADLLRRHLQRHAPQIALQVVPDAKAALETIPATDDCSIDAVLCGGGDAHSHEVLRQLRAARGAELPVILVLEEGSPECFDNALRAGASEVLHKHVHWLQSLPMTVTNVWQRLQDRRELTALRERQAKLEARIARRSRSLATVRRDIDAIVGAISHDLRAPLRGIDGLTALLQQRGGADDDARHMLGLLREGAKKLDDQVVGLVRYARVARDPLKRAPVRVSSLVRHCLEPWRHEIEGRGIVVRLGELPDCHADVERLQQVFSILLTNAIKFTRRQSRPRIDVGATELDGTLGYFVRDNGVGFDMRYASKLFGPFQRLHRIDEFEGAGIELAIASRLVELHGGRIAVMAIKDEGATFTFNLGR